MVNTEGCKLMGKELRETAPAARGSKEAGFTQFLAHKSTLLSKPPFSNPACVRSEWNSHKSCVRTRTPRKGPNLHVSHNVSLGSLLPQDEDGMCLEERRGDEPGLLRKADRKEEAALLLQHTSPTVRLLLSATPSL